MVKTFPKMCQISKQFQDDYSRINGNIHSCLTDFDTSCGTILDSVITKPFFSHFFRARVDVHRKDSVGSVEKAITIYGQPENCSNACLQILKVMQEEARNTDKTDDIPLKILGKYRVSHMDGINFTCIIHSSEI